MKKIKLLAYTALITAGLAACTPMTNVRGHFLQDYQLTDIKIGQDTKTDILRKIGSPTTKAVFDENVWYYIGQKTEKRGILDAKVVEERIIVAVFNKKGLLQSIDEVDAERLDIPYIKDKTPTSGHEITVMQQLLGNLGRFNPESTK